MFWEEARQQGGTCWGRRSWNLQLQDAVKVRQRTIIYWKLVLTSVIIGVGGYPRSLIRDVPGGPPSLSSLCLTL